MEIVYLCEYCGASIEMQEEIFIKQRTESFSEFCPECNEKNFFVIKHIPAFKADGSYRCFNGKNKKEL